MQKVILLVALTISTTVATVGLAANNAVTPGALQELQAMHVDATVERLIQFAADGDLATVNLLIAAGVSVRASDPVRHVTVLHNASAQGHARIVSRLLDLGADVNARDWNGLTPLIDATYNGHVAVVNLLLARGERTNVQPARGPSALLAAIQTGSFPLVELLLASGADPSQADPEGHTPLMAAVRTNRLEIIARVKAALVKQDAK